MNNILSITLKKIDKDNDLSYNTLSEEMKKIIDKNELILGIDLGTTYSCASVMLDHRIVLYRKFFRAKNNSFICLLFKK
jgi:activator of 2-hydroxyglutaryl-CoA dehydratase